ncbi:MAG: penicillin-binding protein 2 [Verrucomicrobia bacterium]|nr:penicillin-binding protein 2 [Verrucomicrobiota bacterium]
MLILDKLRKADRRLRALAIVVLCGLVTLLAGLWYVQILNATHYRETLKDQAVRTVRIPAVRGQILDRNGIALAENRPSYNVELYLAELTKVFNQQYRLIRPAGRLTRAQIETLERQARFEVVSNIIVQVGAGLNHPGLADPTNFARHYEGQRALPFPVLHNLQPDQVARFVERPASVPGVELEIEARRVYPFQSTAAHVLGTLKRDDRSAEGEDSDYHYRLPDVRGLTGIEARFDRELRGRAGGKRMMVNRLGYRQSEALQNAPEPGHNVVLTLDLELQRAAERALLTTSHGTNTRGAAVVLDTQTGDILAMASAPTFDPNQFLRPISHGHWEYLDDRKLRPQVNRATQENYQPGSIFKIVVGLAALEAGVLDPSEKVRVEPSPTKPGLGAIFVGKRKIEDTVPPGDYDFRRALAQSSNTYFIHQGLKPGVLQKIIELGQKLGLGQRTDTLPRQEARGNFPSARDALSAAWRDGHTANVCIGQGDIDVTPLQMAVMTAAVANGGKVFWPRIVSRIEPLDSTFGEPPTLFPPARLRAELGVRAENLQVVRDAMLADVEDPRGTGRDVWIPDFRISGKTGTSQVEQGGEIVDHITWFVSYGPAQDPRFAVVVMVESGASGAKTCVPVAKQIYLAIQKRFAAPKPARLAANTPI